MTRTQLISAVGGGILGAISTAYLFSKYFDVKRNALDVFFTFLFFSLIGYVLLYAVQHKEEEKKK